MTDKTIPLLAPASSIDGNTLFIIDTGTQTFKVEADVIALFMRESVLPAGMIVDFAGSEADIASGWLPCAGQAISRTTYSRLFLAIGTTYGTGDGSTTFNLPDCRGRVRAGKDNMGGTAANRITNAIAGFVGTVLGAFGGGESYTPAGVNGGSQSIAHVHYFGHTHGMQHAHKYTHNHVWSYSGGTGTALHSIRYGNVSSSHTSIGASDPTLLGGRTISIGASTTYVLGEMLAHDGTGAASQFVTTGVVNGINGNGSSAYTELSNEFTGGVSGASSDTNGMSTSSNVNGSNFTFTGTTGHRVQPTLIVNTIIKT